MKLKDQVTSLKLSRQLKELGVEQGSLFIWTKTKYWEGSKTFDWEIKVGVRDRFRNTANPRNIRIDISEDIKAYSAFTASEILERLPALLKSNRFGMNYPIQLQVEKQKVNYKKGWEKNYYCYYAGTKRYLIQENNSLANALAKMLIYLIKNKFLKE